MAAMTNAGGVFVIGVDTGVGKTTLCAGLLKMLVGSRKVAYWKPVQTGTIVGDDTKDIRKATQLSDDYFVEPAYRFPDPLSPHFAARKWGKTPSRRPARSGRTRPGASRTPVRAAIAPAAHVTRS